jgi:hypothetical protein
MQFRIVSALLLITAVPAFAAGRFESMCEPKDGKVLMDTVVLPILKAKEANILSNFELGNPAVFKRSDGNTAIIVMQHPNIMEAPPFEVVLEGCSSHVLSAGELDPFTMRPIHSR